MPLIVGLLVIMALFATADFYLNKLDAKPVLNWTETADSVVSAKAPDKEAAIDSQFALDGKLGGYMVVSQMQTDQVFEKIDLSNIKNVSIYRNELEKVEGLMQEEKDSEGEGLVESEAEKPSIYLYELQGPENQGSLTYLNAKLQFIAQINTVTETLNETGEYGDNSFYFNNKNYENTAFLLTQIGDDLFGFQYQKGDEGKAFEDVKKIINLLTTENQSINSNS